MEDSSVSTGRKRQPNRLIHEKSPYLLQHAFNPVDWYPWGDEAFQRASQEQKPIFLSIGYSTCHWCHVMERESFENDSIAAVLNRHFVCIKVDREERPDVDKVYMTALQGMGQNGGWPLTMFLTPDRRPFYGGTYFPPETRYGRIGLPDLLLRIHEIWENERGKVIESADGITNFLRQMPASHEPVATYEGLFDKCFEQISRTYDPGSGGFGQGPKFPRPVIFNFLTRYYARSGNQRALEMTAHTLQRMYEGGIHDQIGGGFHRYSVDGEWRVPHFEKMLYDQAQLVMTLVDLFLITKDEQFPPMIRDILGYVSRDLGSAEGGFFSAEDADSRRPDAPGEEGEGAFYVWTRKELTEILGSDAGEIFCRYYGVEDSGNVLMDPQHEFTGRNILYVAQSVESIAKIVHQTKENILVVLSDARRKLFSARTRRPRPLLDDKILTSWNSLMISAFTRAYQALDDESYLQLAQRGADFILSRMSDRETGRLIRRYRDGEARFEAHLDDYAFFVQCLLDLYEGSRNSRWLEAAMRFNETMIGLFWDNSGGGFFDTSGSDPSVLIRTKELYDGAEPSGNSIAALNLLRLSHMTGNDDWRKKAELTISAFGDVLDNQPSVMPQMVCAADFLQSTPREIVIAGVTGDEGTKRILREVFSRYMPGRVLIHADGGKQQEWLGQYLPFVKSVAMLDGKPTAYICENYVCRLPTSDPEIVAQLLDGKI